MSLKNISLSIKSYFRAEKSRCTIMFTPAIIACLFLIITLTPSISHPLSLLILTLTYIGCLVIQIFTLEPIHIQISRNNSEIIKDKFLENGFKLLKKFKEIKKKGQVWGVEHILDDNYTLHVRAIFRSGDSFLSAHREIRRDKISHLWTNSDYETGRQILFDIMTKKAIILLV